MIDRINRTHEGYRISVVEKIRRAQDQTMCDDMFGRYLT